ncbi:MAG: hypothetical protein ACPHQP_07660 [Longimicrobiales bacterium]
MHPGGTPLFTLILQGLTIERVVRHFGLHIPTMSDQLAWLEGGIAGKLRALDAMSLLQAGGLFPPPVAKTVEIRANGELSALRKELEVLRARELDEDPDRGIRYPRSFGTERARYYDMFGHGHLT